MNRFRLALFGLLLVGTMSLNGCCWFFAAGAAVGGAAAYSYNFNSLQTIEEVPVTATHQALLRGLHDLNIQLTRDTSDQISGEIRGYTARYDSVVVTESVLTPHTTQITIRVGWGCSVAHKCQAEAIYDAMDKYLSKTQPLQQPQPPSVAQ